MIDARLSRMTIDQLIKLYVWLSKRQAELMLLEFYDDAQYRPVYNKLTAIEQELHRRGPNAVRSLLPLLDYPSSWGPLLNPETAQVRLNAARELLDIEPERAKAALKELAARDHGVQGAEARMALDPITEE